MTKKYYTREELIERERKKRAKRMGEEPTQKEEPKKKPVKKEQSTQVQKSSDRIIKTNKGYAIKVETFEDAQAFAAAATCSPEVREKQNAVIEQNKFKRVMLSNEQ